METIDQDRVHTLRELNTELRSHCARLERMLWQRDEFLRSLCDPDVFGYAISEEVRAYAYRLLRSYHE